MKIVNVYSTKTFAPFKYFAFISTFAKSVLSKSYDFVPLLVWTVTFVIAFVNAKSNIVAFINPKSIFDILPFSILITSVVATVLLFSSPVITSEFLSSDTFCFLYSVNAYLLLS